ncbi:MAG TPA: isoprenylcysteine carboxylmethyltransferase family protein [Thermoplasmata archaeon]|nr:isoprenylcysteine carboxylmethyltransferase family protein [Thermoplasmata archaeon]
MLDAGTVRIVGGLLFLAPFAAAAMYGRSVLAPRGATVAARDPARGTEALWLGTIGVAQLWTLGVVLMPQAFYAWPLFGDFPGSAGIQMLGLLVWFLAGGLAVWSFRTLGRFMTVSIRVMEGHRLVQEGPYAWIRHPTYTAVVALVVGLALVFLSLPLILLALLLAVLARYRAGLEEDLLRSPQGFGAAYEAYMARTGRFLPRLRRSGG